MSEYSNSIYCQGNLMGRSNASGSLIQVHPFKTNMVDITKAIYLTGDVWQTFISQSTELSNDDKAVKSYEAIWLLLETIALYQKIYPYAVHDCCFTIPGKSQPTISAWIVIAHEDVLLSEGAVTVELATEYYSKSQLANRIASDTVPLRHLMDVLPAYRCKKKLSQRNVATKLHTTSSAISRMESGGGKKQHSPSLRNIASYANALDCEITCHIHNRQYRKAPTASDI
tara:strand:- start:39664 stop:40347 length:684 start_codon:yes stop_codon:yes gene_type:complete